jgi:AraC-like DNA-binding protein
MTDTARDEHSLKNGALGNGNHPRGLAPSGVAHGSALNGGGVGAAPSSQVTSVREPGTALTAVSESPRSAASLPSAPFGSTELRSSELESGVHLSMNVAAPPRPAVEAPSVDLVLLAVTETQVAPGWCSPEEELDSYELTVMVRGTQHTTREDGEASSGPVEALLLRPGARRQERNKGEVDLHRLRVTFHWRSAPSELPETVQDTCGRLHEIASWLVAERDAQFPNVSEYRHGLLRALVGEYLRLSVVAASRIEEKTRTYMLRHLGEPITLEDLATNIGMSRYYFCRVYKEVAGHTPMEHLRALRLERAKDLIRSTALPLKAIAPEVGFGSAQHLCRLLHDRFGVGVRELRGAGTLESRGVASDRGRDPEEAS